MSKKINIVLLLLALVFCSLTTSVTYARFMISKSTSGTITVPEDNFCINNGFNTLSDCMLVMEDYSESVPLAMNYITSKGPATTSQTAPTINYKEVTQYRKNENGVISTSNHFTLGKSYKFNVNTGRFELIDYVNIPLTDDYIDYYTCGSTTSSLNSCPTMYQIKAYKKVDTIERTTYYVTEAIRHTINIVDSFDSEIGLYKTSDELGDTYFYRGNVQNNYVSFAGFIWRIVRRNGDGSVRLIYAGTKTSDIGSSSSIGTSQFNSKDYDPTYVGYTYNEDFVLNTTNTVKVNYEKFQEDAKIFYGANYRFDETIKKFYLMGDMIYGKWEEKHEEAIASYPYTCFSTDSGKACDYIFKIDGYTSRYQAKGTYISYSSKSYESILQGGTDSIIKTKVDSWYEDNLLTGQDEKGNKYESYLVDLDFCNDRSVASGSGYLLAPSTYFGARNRNYTQKNPSLMCTQDADRHAASRGNLKYPIALLTADEVAFGGGLYDAVNTRYYLYTNQNYWTISPSYFQSERAYSRVLFVSNYGYLSNSTVISSDVAIRPVINLSKDVLITGGDGTASNPYTVTKTL